MAKLICMALAQRHLDRVLIKGVPPAKVRYLGYSDADKYPAVNANYLNTRFRNDDPVSIANKWLDRDSRPPALYSASNVAGSIMPLLSDLAAYLAYVVNATNVTCKKCPKSPHFLDVNAVLELLKRAVWNRCYIALVRSFPYRSRWFEVDIQLALNFATNQILRLIIK
jgi:hypothetical protein